MKEKYKKAYGELRLKIRSDGDTSMAYTHWMITQYGYRATFAAYTSYMASFKSDCYSVPFRWRITSIPF